MAFILTNWAFWLVVGWLAVLGITLAWCHAGAVSDERAERARREALTRASRMRGDDGLWRKGP
jgi:hypothetical protein